MKKRSVIIALVMCLLAAAAVGVLLYKTGFKFPIPHDVTTTEPAVELNTEEYLGYRVSESPITSPLMKTNIDGVFYTVGLDGSVAFYGFDGSAPTPIAETGTLDVTVSRSGQTVPATIHYYENEDGRLTGYGLFTPGDDSSVLIFDYALFELRDLPESYERGNTALLLMDTTKSDFYKGFKVWEECFYCNLNNGTTTDLVSVDNRTFDYTGAGRADYCMFTNEAVDDCVGKWLFFSGRHYQLFETEHKMDIIQAGGSGNNTDNIRYLENAAEFYIRHTDDAVIWLKTTEIGFDVMSHPLSGDGEDTVIRSFDGNFYENYLRDGDIILNKKTFETYNLVTDELAQITITGSEDFVPDMFVCSEDGSFFMRGLSQNTAAIVVGSNGSGKALYNEAFRYITTPFISGGNAVFSSATDDTGTAYTISVYKVG